MDRKFKNGFGIVEALVAAGIVSLSFLAINSALQGNLNISLKSRLIARQIALESALLTAIQDSTNYTTAAKNSLISGSSPANWELKANGVVVAQVGVSRFFTVHGASCAALDTINCFIQTNVDVSCTGNMCFAAYRIMVQAPRKYTISNLGSRLNSGFETADYLIPIPYDLYLGKQDVGTCPAATSLGARGFNRDTGSLSCLLKPSTSCAAGTFGTALTFNTTTSRVEITCTSASQKLTCPANYALRSFTPNSLFPGNAKTGKCIFIGRNSVPSWASNPPIGHSISNRQVCPLHYLAVPSCKLVNVVSKSVTCPAPCKTTLNPVAGTCVTSVSGPKVTAYVTAPAQPKCTCSADQASWTANLLLTGSCSLNEPLEVNPI